MTVTRITAPGIYDLPAEVYHADPCPEPSLSASIARAMMERSPLHAWWEHPRLNPERPTDEPTPSMEEGAAMHALILENTDLVEVIDAADWRTKAAQEARHEARAAGRIPLLAARWEELQAMARTVRRRLAGHREAPDALTAGRPEQTMVWCEETAFGPVWCRARVDWLQDDPRGWIDDLKTVAQTAEPDAWGRAMASDGRAMQAAFYLRGARALGRQPRGFRFIVVEREAPFAVSVASCAPDLLHIAEEQVELAIERWAECLARYGRKEWPGYTPRIAWIEAPGWLLARHEERGAREMQRRKDDREAVAHWARVAEKIGSPVA